MSFAGPCQSLFESVMQDAEILVVDAHEMQNCGVEVADVDFVFGSSQTDCVCGTV